MLKFEDNFYHMYTLSVWDASVILRILQALAVFSKCIYICFKHSNQLQNSGSSSLNVHTHSTGQEI
jgi:hypothetical protein